MNNLQQKAQHLRDVTVEYQQAREKMKDLHEQTEQAREKCHHLASARDKAYSELINEVLGKDLAKTDHLLFG
jgi:septation ring formation regulator EzrA